MQQSEREWLLLKAEKLHSVPYLSDQISSLQLNLDLENLETAQAIKNSPWKPVKS